MKKTIKIESEDMLNYFKEWFTLHEIYLDGEFVGQAGDAVGEIERLGIDLSQVTINDDHTRDVLKDVYKSKWITERYSGKYTR
tara:strand:+ start:932 stop:1180 length:249 start_codon:yes stop_codon:yes gene_type:complete